MDELECAVRRLEERAAAESLEAEYARRLDEHDWHGMAGLFGPSGDLVSVGGVGAARGSEAISGMFENALRGIEVGAFHILANLRVGHEDDTVTAAARWLYITAEPNGDPKLLQCGRYADVLEEDDGDGEWRFARKEIRRDMGAPPYKR